MEITKTIIKNRKKVVETDPNPAGAFILYAVIGLIGLIWGYYFIPETKSITLEEGDQTERHLAPFKGFSRGFPSGAPFFYLL